MAHPAHPGTTGLKARLKSLLTPHNILTKSDKAALVGYQHFIQGLEAIYVQHCAFSISHTYSLSCMAGSFRVPLFPSVLFSFCFDFFQNKTEGFPGITFSFAVKGKSLFPSVFSKTEAFQNIQLPSKLKVKKNPQKLKVKKTYHQR